MPLRLVESRGSLTNRFTWWLGGRFRATGQPRPKSTLNRKSGASAGPSGAPDSGGDGLWILHRPRSGQYHPPGLTPGALISSRSLIPSATDPQPSLSGSSTIIEPRRLEANTHPWPLEAQGGDDWLAKKTLGATVHLVWERRQERVFLIPRAGWEAAYVGVSPD